MDMNEKHVEINKINYDKYKTIAMKKNHQQIKKMLIDKNKCIKFKTKKITWKIVTI